MTEVAATDEVDVGCAHPRGSPRGQGPPRMRSCIAFGDGGRWRGGHAATDEVDVGCALHDRRCGRCRSPSPAAACVIPCFQFSMLLHNLSSIFSLGKKASQRALRCTRVPHRTAATTCQPKASTTPAPAESACQTGPDQKPLPHPHIPPCRHCPMLRRARPPPEPASAPPHPRPRAPLLSTAAPPPDHARLKVPIRLPAAPAPARTGLSALKQVFHTLSTEFSTFSPVSHSGFLSPWLSLRETG